MEDFRIQSFMFLCILLCQVLTPGQRIKPVGKGPGSCSVANRLQFRLLQRDEQHLNQAIN